MRSIANLKRDSRLTFHVQFVGGGNQDHLKKYAKKLGINKQCFFKGITKSGDDIFRWMDNIDMYIQPSFAEGQGRAVIEAMSRGCPVISSDAGGLKETVLEEHRFESGNHLELSRLILDFATSPSYTLKAAKRNFNFAKSFYSVNVEKRRNTFLKNVLMS